MSIWALVQTISFSVPSIFKLIITSTPFHSGNDRRVKIRPNVRRLAALDKTAWTFRFYMDIIGGSRGWVQGVRTPLKNHKNIGFLCNTGPDPLKNHKATKPAFNVGPSPVHQRNAISMAFRWWVDDGPLIVVFWIIPPLINYKNVIKVGPPLTKLSGSAHGYYVYIY